MSFAALILAVTIHPGDNDYPTLRPLRPSSPTCIPQVREIDSETIKAAGQRLAWHREQIVLSDDGETTVVVVVNTVPNCSHES